MSSSAVDIYLRRFYLRRFSRAGGQAGVDLQRRHQLIKAEILDREALLDSPDTQTHAQMRLAHPWRTSVILPGVRHLRFGSHIRSTLAAARWSPLSAPSVMSAPITSSSANPTGP